MDFLGVSNTNTPESEGKKLAISSKNSVTFDLRLAHSRSHVVVSINWTLFLGPFSVELCITWQV